MSFLLPLVKHLRAFHSGKEIRKRDGFTLIELMAVIAIIGILSTLMLPEIGTIRERAEKVVCMGHLRSLHVALGSYLNDNEQWPQLPKDANGAEADLSPQDEEQFWFDALKDYGIGVKDWQCPTLTRLLGLNNPNADTSEAPKMHYTPTHFDDNPLTPRKWAAMPWLVENGDIHHGGALIIRADGAVRTDMEAVNAFGN
ncbi:MAG: type II secretion system protein [Verrucomicrobiota bacterium]